MKPIQKYLILIVILISACTSPQIKMKNSIKEKEDVLLANLNKPSVEQANDLIKSYLNYVSEFQDDTICADYLFKAADLSAKTNKFDQAVDLFGRVQRFPNYRKTAQALFLQGFIMENNLHKPQIAKTYYEKFLDRYPNHKLANDVRLILQTIDISPEELVKQFEKQNQFN